MENSYIQWTDHTFNPWEGCTKVSPGCANCYAETRNARFGGGTATNWGPGAPRRRTSVQNWNQPRKWNREADRQYIALAHQTGAGEVIKFQRPRVFCASLADWLDDEVPIEWLADLLDLIRTTPSLDWLLLTKRPENFRVRMVAVMNACVGRVDLENWIYSWIGEAGDLVLKSIPAFPPAHVWIGTTVEDQTRAEQRMPELVEIPAKVKFISYEPACGPINLDYWMVDCLVPQIQWVICGCESGPKRRAMPVEWALSVGFQCAVAKVAFFMKQMDVGGKVSGEMGEFPEALRIREFPKAKA